MQSSTNIAPNEQYASGLTKTLIFIMALACGAIVANLYYAQTLVSLIGKDLHFNPSLTGFIVTLTQIGCGAGLLFIIPLADLIENRRLIVGLLCSMTLSLLGFLFSNTSGVFLSFCFLLGLTGVAAQVIVPFAAHLSPPEIRGKVVGHVTSGLLCGIMLARPLASWLTDLFSWKAIFILSAFLMIILAMTLRCLLPRRIPSHQLNYGKLLVSMPKILIRYPLLQRRAIYHAMMFGVFSLFWTSIAMLLMSKIFNYTQAKIALFAFAGVAGAFVAPIAGGVADRGWTGIGTGLAIILVAMAFIIAKFNSGHSIIALVIAALVLDIGVSCNLVLGQRAIYTLAPEIRGRLNSLYMTIFFIGGAIGSALAGYLYVKGGWSYITNIGLLVSAVAFLYYLTEYFKRK